MSRDKHNYSAVCCQMGWGSMGTGQNWLDFNLDVAKSVRINWNKAKGIGF